MVLEVTRTLKLSNKTGLCGTRKEEKQLSLEIGFA